ncbi:MAG: hypothetical protein KBS74_08945 [Clostridiales bacterium]|nr:hypothetical protein [Candidatus Cacconaster stercorequi]
MKKQSISRMILCVAVIAALLAGSSITAFAESPDYVIHNYMELEQFACSVNSGNSYEGKVIALADDFGTEEGTLTTPIGLDHPFDGTFDGNGRSVKLNIVSDTQLDFAGMFGGISKDAAVENLTVTGNVAGDAYCVGGICGTNFGRVVNCTNNAGVTGEEFVGGICGINGNGAIVNCINNGDIAGKSQVNGICGDNQYGTIVNCSNSGKVDREADSASLTGSVLSEGSLAIVSAVLGIAVGIAGTLLVMKKKKPAPAAGGSEDGK